MSAWDDWDGVPVLCSMCASLDCEHAQAPEGSERVWGIELEERLTGRLRVIAPTREEAEEAAIEGWWGDRFVTESDLDVTDVVPLEPAGEE
jgi:hypothetical protein